MARHVGIDLLAWRLGLALGIAIYIMLHLVHKASALDNCQWQYVQVCLQQDCVLQLNLQFSRLA